MKSMNKSLNFYSAYIELTGNTEYSFYVERVKTQGAGNKAKCHTWQPICLLYQEAQEPRGTFFPLALLLEYKPMKVLPTYVPNPKLGANVAK